MKTGAAPSEDDLLVVRSGAVLPPGTKITPMLRQWLAAKAKAPDAILLFRMGDFYELFGDDARLAGDVLDLSVTTRDRDKGDGAMPMAGFPHPAAPGYIARLIAAGLKVAVCDQMEDPATAKGIVKRDVTRLVTPGMVLDDESLDARSNNFLVAVIAGALDDDRHRFGLCALDVSTGEVVCTTASSEAAVIDEVYRLAPREIVVDEALAAGLVSHLVGETRPGTPPRRLERRAAPTKRKLVDTLGAPDAWLLDAAHRPALLAAELALGYAEETGQGVLPKHLRSPVAFSLDERLLLDATTRAHLELTGPSNDVRRMGSLLWHVDRTRTAAGGRRLLRLLLEPSASMSEIATRHDRLAVLVDDATTRSMLAEQLTSLADVERLVARAANGRAGPRELWRLGSTLLRLPTVASTLFGFEPWAGLIVPLGDAIERCSEVSELLDRALVSDAPHVLGDERVFREGYDADLDELWALTTNGQGAIAALEAKEREATGISSLKVRFNNVFGYYIEVTKTHQAKVPAHYTRKQTIANGERFVTDELATLQEQVEGADARRRRREGELFSALLSKVQQQAQALSALAAFVADVDAVLSFADVAVEDRCVRPTMLAKEERRLELVEARHPVVERLCRSRGESFVPSSVQLDGDRQILVVTGPNMAGKSTLMRQVALCQLLAQAGAFVPAKTATLSLCDRIFTRVGAADDTATGRSTFMVEMTETSHILRGATPCSLVLLDEIGRGTSTFDGLAIAWAVAEHIHDEVGARTLFATHYHELTALSASLPRLKNVHVVVKEWGDDIVFVRSLEEGPAGRSFGIQVARLAGLPVTVVSRAREVLAHLEGDEIPAHAAPNKGLPKSVRRPTASSSTSSVPQMSLFGGPAPEADAPAVSDDRWLKLAERVKAVDINRLTPMQAMNVLAELVDQARKG